MVWVCDWLFFGMMFIVEPYLSTESEMVVHPAGSIILCTTSVFVRMLEAA